MKLTLIRGLPGSGKSTKAKTFKCLHVEADMYHVNSGVYEYHVNDVKHAHRWCQEMVSHAMTSLVDIVVSNTFTQKWELQPYLDMAEEYGYEVEILTMRGQYDNTHNVPQEVLNKMRERWEE